MKKVLERKALEGISEVPTVVSMRLRSTLIPIMSLILVCSGCSSVKYAKTGHSYTIPAAVKSPLEHTYALLRSEAGRDKIFEHPGFGGGGMNPANHLSAADYVFRVRQSKIEYGAIQTIDKSYDAQTVPQNGQSQTVKVAAWSAQSSARIRYRVEARNHQTGELIRQQSHSVTDQLRLDPKTRVSTEAQARSLMQAAVQNRVFERQIHQLEDTALNEAVRRLDLIANDMTRDHFVSIRIEVPARSKHVPELSEAFNLLVRRRNESDIRKALEMYRRIGTSNTNDKGKPLVDENYASAYGAAVCYFLLGEYSMATRQSDLALTLRNKRAARDLLIRSREMLRRQRGS